MEREERARVYPKDMFRAEAYSAWDEDGGANKDGDGDKLTNSKRTKLRMACEGRGDCMNRFRISEYICDCSLCMAKETLWYQEENRRPRNIADCEEQFNRLMMVISGVNLE